MKKVKTTPKNIEVHFECEGQTVEMIYDNEKKDFMLNTPGQEGVFFENKTISESINIILACIEALNYIKTNYGNDIHSHDKRATKGNKKNKTTNG